MIRKIFVNKNSIAREKMCQTLLREFEIFSSGANQEG